MSDPDQSPQSVEEKMCVAPTSPANGGGDEISTPPRPGPADGAGANWMLTPAQQTMQTGMTTYNSGLQMTLSAMKLTETAKGMPDGPGKEAMLANARAMIAAGGATMDGGSTQTAGANNALLTPTPAAYETIRSGVELLKTAKAMPDGPGKQAMLLNAQNMIVVGSSSPRINRHGGGEMVTEEQTAEAKKHDAEHAAEIAEHAARVKASDKPLEDDPIGNMIPGLLVAGPKALIQGGAKGAKELFFHLLHEASQEFTDGPKPEPEKPAP